MSDPTLNGKISLMYIMCFGLIHFDTSNMTFPVMLAFKRQVNPSWLVIAFIIP